MYDIDGQNLPTPSSVIGRAGTLGGTMFPYNASIPAVLLGALAALPFTLTSCSRPEAPEELQKHLQEKLIKAKSGEVIALPAGKFHLDRTLSLTAATPFLVNLDPSSPAAPSSSLVGFYQTLPLSSEVPYVVETRAVDPTSGVFASDQALSGGSLQYGTYISGGAVSLTTRIVAAQASAMSLYSPAPTAAKSATP